MIDYYQNDISYPRYIHARPNGKDIFNVFINKLIAEGGVNLTAVCMSCQTSCSHNVFYCIGCRKILTSKVLETSRSICN